MRSGLVYKIALAAVFGLFLVFPTQAQRFVRPGLYAGIDLTKPLAAMALVAEPNVRYFTGNLLVLSAAYGYVNMRTDSVYYNLRYRNKGSYFKPGVELLFPDTRFSMGLAYLFSNYRESGFVNFAGPYFGDERLELNRKVATRALEINFNLYLPVGNRLMFNFTGRGIAFWNRIRSGNFAEMPVYYMPGAGYAFTNTEPGSGRTLGLNVGIMYRLTGKSDMNTLIEEESRY